MIDKLMQPMPGRFLTEAADDDVNSVAKPVAAIVALLRSVLRAGIASPLAQESCWLLVAVDCTTQVTGCCDWKRERVNVCVCVYERERERSRGREREREVEREREMAHSLTHSEMHTFSPPHPLPTTRPPLCSAAQRAQHVDDAALALLAESVARGVRVHMKQKVMPHSL